MERSSYALILAGLLGNLIDRLFFGSVTDMFDLGWWPIFNVADSTLVIGVIGLVVYEIFWKGKNHS
uniref:MMGP5 n=1 Tax=uncultured organism TaxID=155900 RepID=G9HQ34_9ZZZZ|nr:MMGP5 [uncultured organism]